MSDPKKIQKTAAAAKVDIPALMIQADKAREAGFMVDVLLEQRNNAMNLAANMQAKANMVAEELAAAKGAFESLKAVAVAHKNEAVVNHIKQHE